MKILIFSIWLFFAFDIIVSNPCVLKKFTDGYVCVCNSSYCDYLKFSLPDQRGIYKIISSSQDGLRYQLSNGQFSVRTVIKDYKLSNISSDGKKCSNSNSPKIVSIKINSKIKYQKIIGFGGAFTGAVSYNLKQLDQNLQNHVYKMYYSLDEGNGYTMMRIPIGGCDFDLSPWAYNESPENDIGLSNFTKLDPRDLQKIEQIKMLKNISDNNRIKIIGAAWSSPKWMKTNNEWTGFSALRTEYYQTWADYHIRYLELMEREGMKYWAVSTGNEPMNAIIGSYFVRFMSLGWTGYTQGKWVAENFGPSLKKFFPDIILLAGDDQRYTFPIWFNQMKYFHPKSMDYIDGFAVHWYWNFLIPPSTIDQTHNLFDNKIIINTEASLGDKPWEHHGPVLGSWDRAEKYIQNIITDLNHWINAWIDWNLILDERGAPNYVNNFVDSAVIVNSENYNEIYKQPIFYVMGHFSRFITPGSVHIESSSSDNNIHVTSFERDDGYIVVVLYNKFSCEVNLNISYNENTKFELQIPAKSIHSIIFKEIDDLGFDIRLSTVSR